MTAPSSIDQIDRSVPTEPRHIRHIAEAALLSADSAHRFVQDSGTAALLAAAAIVRAQDPTTGRDPDEVRDAVGGIDLTEPLGSTEAALAEASTLYLDDAVFFSTTPATRPT